ncbi:MAG: hypothetical protein ACI8X5_001684 [Planctomycetota bacterium]|jgi:hypothetical protein
MLTRLAALLLSFLMFGAPAVALERPTSEILEEVLDKKDGCNVGALFELLGSRKDREAFDAMTEGLEVLLEDRNITSAHRALRHFKGVDPKLEASVIKYLDKGLRKSKDEAGYARAVALAIFEGTAEKELMYHLERQADDRVRAACLKGVLEILVEEGSGDSLDIILENYKSSHSGSSKDLQNALEHLYKAVHKKRAFKRLDYPLSSGVSRHAAIIRVFGRIPGEAVDDLLIDLTAGKSSLTRAWTLEAMVDREGKKVTEAFLERFEEERDPRARGYALRGLLTWESTNKQAAKQLDALVHSKKVLDRETAAYSLSSAEAGDVQLLIVLLGDSATSVRSLARDSALDRRDKVVVPVLIELLETDDEERKAVQHVLNLLTGEDHGDRPQRWRSWWAGEGAGLVLPSLSDARKSKESCTGASMRRDRESRYGLNIQGKGAYLILDTSDSMTGIFERIRSEGKTIKRISQLDVLREEVVGALKRTPDGQLLNMILFGTTLQPFSTKLVELDEKTREDAIRFVEKSKTLGATALFDALELAFKDKRMDAIYLVSDGDPKGGKVDDQEELLAAVQKWNRKDKVKINCIDLQRSPSKFLKELADANGGEYRHVPAPFLSGY